VQCSKEKGQKGRPDLLNQGQAVQAVSLD